MSLQPHLGIEENHEYGQWVNRQEDLEQQEDLEPRAELLFKITRIGEGTRDETSHLWGCEAEARIAHARRAWKGIVRKGDKVRLYGQLDDRDLNTVRWAVFYRGTILGYLSVNGTENHFEHPNTA